LTFFLKDALETLLAERVYLKNKIDIDKQMSEASHVYRRLLAAIPHLQIDQSLHKPLQLYLTLLHAFLT
jgi:hypothetical protein